MFGSRCFGDDALGFLDRVLPEASESIDRDNKVPSDVLAAAIDAGLFRIDSVECLISAVRRAAKHSRGFAHVMLVHGSARLAVGSVEGIYALSITEPGGGTDVRANLKTVAEPAGGDLYSVRGTKFFTSNALYASHFVVLALAGDGPAMLVCERDNSTVKVEPLELSGFRGSGVAKVVYDGTLCRRVSREGVDGVREALRYINVGRLGYAALALGMADRAMELIYRVASSKKVFGKSLIEYQGVMWAVARLEVKAKALESLVLESIRKGVDPEMSAIAKIMAGELGSEAGWAAVQIMGGRGLSMWGEAERMYRDAKVLDIGEGAREVLLDFIAGRVFKRLAKGS